jgi:hypothetical protein
MKFLFFVQEFCLFGSGSARLGVVDMLIAGAVTAGGVLGTGAGVGLYAYQTVQFRDHYQLVRCSPIGPSWCR